MAAKSKDVTGPPAVRVEFFGSGEAFGYRRCANDGTTLSEVSPMFTTVGDAVEAAIADDDNAGLSIQDPSFAHRPFAGW